MTQKTLVALFLYLSYSCQAGPLCEYEERIATEKALISFYMSQGPAPVEQPQHNPDFLYPPIAPVPEPAQEPDLFDEITNSVANFIDWLKH